MKTPATYDYIICGAGSAGCVVAARLSEAPEVKVMLLEAGGADRNPFIHVPAGFYKVTSGPLTWGMKTVPQRHAMDREILYEQGRVLGGSGSINAQVFTRGRPQDYDGWAEEFGCRGWAFKDIQRYFLRSEDNDTFAGTWHGIGGPLGVSSPSPHPLTRAFVQSCQELGMPYNSDFNGARQDGAGFYQTTTRHARRCSTAVGYLRPVLRRSNLSLRTGTEIRRVVVEKGRAVGVDVIENGRLTTLRAEREVILTSGAVNSPKLLLLSGIGPADELRAMGIDVVANLPGVGQNLHDHFSIDIVGELKGPYSLDKYNRLHWMIWAGLEYALLSKGPAASTIVEGGAFWYADEGAAAPDLQFHFLSGAAAKPGIPAIPSGSGVTLTSYALRPRARGSVRLRSSEPTDLPIVDPNFLGDRYDLEISAAGVKLSREIMQQPALSRYVRKEHFPADRVHTEADFETYAKQYGRTAHHPVGTCRMGGDTGAVVDPELRVRGVEGLRICDSSIMPRLVSSNTNAPSIMIGEKASDLILGRTLDS